MIRHRGFEVLSLNAENNGSGITLNVTVQSERAMELLLNQLVKLPDVVAIS